MIVRILKFCSSSSCFSCLFQHVKHHDYHSLNYYEVLGIDTSQDEDSIDSAMIDTAFNDKLVELNLHRLQFEEYTIEERKTYMLLSKAYHVLTNPKRRALYNRIGYVGLNLIEHPSSLNLFTLFQSIRLTHSNDGDDVPQEPSPTSSSIPVLGKVFFAVLVIALVFYCILIGNKLDGIGYGSRLRWIVLLLPLWIFDALLLLTTLIFILEEREDNVLVNEENESNLHVSNNSRNHHSIPSNVQQISYDELSGNRLLMATSSMLNTAYDDTGDGYGTRGTAVLNAIRSICFVGAQYAFVMKVDDDDDGGTWSDVSWTLVLLPWILYEVFIMVPKLIALTCEEHTLPLQAPSIGKEGEGGMRPAFSTAGFKAYRGIDYDTGSLLFNVDASEMNQTYSTPAVEGIGVRKPGRHSYTPLGGVDGDNIHDVEQQQSNVYNNTEANRSQRSRNNNWSRGDSSRMSTSSVFNSEKYSNSSNDSIYDDPVVDKNVHVYRQINEANHFFQMIMRIVTDRRQSIVSALRLSFCLLLLIKMTTYASLSWYLVMSPCWIYAVYEFFFLNNMRRWGRSFFKGVNVQLIIASMRTFKMGNLNHFKVQRGAEVLAWVLSGFIVHITFIVFVLCLTIHLDEDQGDEQSASRMSMCNVLLLIGCAYGIGIAAIYYAVNAQSLPSIDNGKSNLKVTVSKADMYYGNGTQQGQGPSQGTEVDASPLMTNNNNNNSSGDINGSEEMKLTSSGEGDDYGSIA